MARAYDDTRRAAFASRTDDRVCIWVAPQDDLGGSGGVRSAVVGTYGASVDPPPPSPPPPRRGTAASASARAVPRSVTRRGDREAIVIPLRRVILSRINVETNPKQAISNTTPPKAAPGTPHRRRLAGLLFLT